MLVNAASGSAARLRNGLTAELYHAGLGYPADFNEEAVGKIALISRGEITFQVKLKMQLQLVRRVVLIYDNIDQSGPFKSFY